MSETALRSDMVVSTGWLAEHLHDPNLVILHVGVRGREDYAGAHIPGARFAALDEIAPVRPGLGFELPAAAEAERLFSRLGIGDDSRVVIYGDWAGLAAARAYWTLEYFGHGDHAVVLDGGLEKWQEEDLPVSDTPPPEPQPAKFTARLNPAVLTGLEAVRQASAAGKPLLIDARPKEEYTGELAIDGVPRCGHIPGGVHLFWQELIQSKYDPQFRPASEMVQRIQAAGMKPDQKTIFYCRTGVQASFMYFVAKLLAYQGTVYDGSFQEWSNAADTNVTK
jgi:thiosulfate/3-mercaptopyruvate sulfurtransferase